MANRGVAFIKDIPGFQDTDTVRLQFEYEGFSHVSETVSGTFDIGPSLLTGSALKAAVKTVIVDWYTNNPSGNYEEWNDLLDSFTLVGGIL